MTKQLNIRSDEAYRLAHEIAEQLGVPITEVVLSALRSFGAGLPHPNRMTPTQRVERDALRALSREAAKHKLPGATSDHSDLYDELGLPK